MAIEKDHKASKNQSLEYRWVSLVCGCMPIMGNRGVLIVAQQVKNLT